eukprot:scaffold1094_cov241-Chaetoceros_neogracile.AAC.3
MASWLESRWRMSCGTTTILTTCNGTEYVQVAEDPSKESLRPRLAWRKSLSKKQKVMKIDLLFPQYRGRKETNPKVRNTV